MSDLKNIRFENDSFLPEGIELIGYRNSRKATLLPRHRHEGVFEICYVHQGVMRYHLDDREVDIMAGELNICRPGEWHSGINNQLEPCRLYWFEVVPEKLFPSGECLDFFLSNPCGKLPVTGNWFRDIAEEILTTCRQRPMDSEISLICLMRLLLIKIARTSPGHITPGADKSVSLPVRKVISAMKQDLLSDKPLSKFLSVSGLQHSTAYENFRNETGFTPNEYRLRLIVERAIELLSSSGLSITEIAYRLNFSSSQYFATVFKKITGYSPRYWRNHFGTPTTK